METKTNTKIRSLLSIRAKLNEIFGDNIIWNENRPTEEGIMCTIYKLCLIGVAIQENGDIEISTNLGVWKTVKLPSEAINCIITMVKESDVYKSFTASFNAGKSYKDFSPNSAEYGYHDFGVAHEPLILEPEDWTAAQWETICKLFGMDNAERIKVSGYKLEAFGLPKISDVAEPQDSESGNAIRKQIIIKVKNAINELAVATDISNQLKGNKDYIDGRICLNRSTDRDDGTKNEVHVYIFEDAETDPKIKI